MIFWIGGDPKGFEEDCKKEWAELHFRLRKAAPPLCPACSVGASADSGPRTQVEGPGRAFAAYQSENFLCLRGSFTSVSTASEGVSVWLGTPEPFGGCWILPQALIPSALLCAGSSVLWRSGQNFTKEAVPYLPGGRLSLKAQTTFMGSWGRHRDLLAPI